MDCVHGAMTQHTSSVIVPVVERGACRQHWICCLTCAAEFCSAPCYYGHPCEPVHPSLPDSRVVEHGCAICPCQPAGSRHGLCAWDRGPGHIYCSRACGRKTLAWRIKLRRERRPRFPHQVVYRASLSARAASRSASQRLRRPPQRGATWPRSAAVRRALVYMLSITLPVNRSGCGFGAGAQGAVAWLLLRARRMMRVTGSWLLLRHRNPNKIPSRATPIPVLEFYAMAKQALLVKETGMSNLHFSSFPLSSALVSRPCFTNTRSPFTSTTATGPWNATVQGEGEVENKVGLFHSRLVALDSATVLTHQQKCFSAAKCSGLATSIVCHFERSCNRSRLFRVVSWLWWAWKCLFFRMI